MKAVNMRTAACLLWAIVANAPAHAVIIVPNQVMVYGTSYSADTGKSKPVFYSSDQISSIPSFDLRMTQSEAAFVALRTEFDNQKFGAGLLQFTITDPATSGWGAYKFYFSSPIWVGYSGGIGYIQDQMQNVASRDVFSFKNVVLNASSNQFSRVTSEGVNGLWSYSFDTRYGDTTQPIVFNFEISDAEPQLAIVQVAVTSVPEPGNALMALSGLCVAGIRFGRTTAKRQS